jgi:hypothetical protein
MQTIPFWPHSLSELSDQAVLNCMAENRAWHKELRQRPIALINTRLAKTITNEEYASKRDRNNKDTAECWRRAGMLLVTWLYESGDRSRSTISSDLLN